MSSMYNIKKLSDYCWTIEPNPGETRMPVRLYASASLIDNMDEKVFEQITNVAQLPGLVDAAIAMPDAHWGYGFPIGGVAAFDPKQGGIISAGGVGFDISCGIRCLRTNLFLDDIAQHAASIADILFYVIPAGVGVGGKIKLNIGELDDVLRGGANWAVTKGYGVKKDLEFIEECGQMAGVITENVSDYAKKRQRNEMGSLGSGNHYCEVQIVDEIYDKKAADAYGLQKDQVIVSIHCGSRGLGHQIGSEYLVSLAKEAKKFGIVLPDRELACAPILSPEGQKYIGAMHAGINCALANRQILTHLTRQVFAEILPKTELETLYDVSHNTCKVEKYVIDGKEKSLFIHRKGATRAFGPGHPEIPERYREVGQPVIIGGSMGTCSYILAGNNNNPAFASASHGAGRSMSRRQALKQWRGKELVDQLKAKGILIRSSAMRGIAEEAPGAYKNVDEVALATEKAGLARRVVKVLPKVCVKG